MSASGRDPSCREALSCDLVSAAGLPWPPFLDSVHHAQGDSDYPNSFKRKMTQSESHSPNLLREHTLKAPAFSVANNVAVSQYGCCPATPVMACDGPDPFLDQIVPPA